MIRVRDPRVQWLDSSFQSSDNEYKSSFNAALPELPFVCQIFGLNDDIAPRVVLRLV